MKQQNSCEPSPEKNDPVHEQRNSAESTDPGEDVSPPTIVVPPSPQGPQPPADKDEARERRTERRDRMRLGVEISAVIVGLIGIGGLFVTFQEMQETNRIARQTLEAQERPWIKVDAALYSPVIFYNSGGIYVGVNFLMENIGHIVATGIHVRTLGVISADALVSKRNALCEWGRLNDDGIHGGTVLFPEKNATIKSWIYIGEMKDIENEGLVTPPTAPEEKYIPLIISGCVTYKSPVDPKRRVTGFMYMVGSKENRWGVPWGKTLPLKDLSIFPHGLTDAYID